MIISSITRRIIETFSTISKDEDESNDLLRRKGETTTIGIYDENLYVSEQ